MKHLAATTLYKSIIFIQPACLQQDERDCFITVDRLTRSFSGRREYVNFLFVIEGLRVPFIYKLKEGVLIHMKSTAYIFLDF